MALEKALPLLGLIFILPALAAAQEKIKFPVAASSKVLGYAPLWVASGKGFLKREGLDAEVTAIRGTAPTMQALVSDSIYVALAANDAVIGLVEKGMDLVMIAAGAKTTHMIMGGKKYKTYEDLRGATIGSSTLTSGTAFLLKRVLKSQGLEYPRDYKLINVGGSGSAFTALSTVVPNYLLSSFSVRREWAADHREEVIRFLKAVLKARRWLDENKQEAADFLAKDLDMKLALARKGLNYYLDNRAWDPNLNIDMDGLKTVVEIYAEQADMKGPIPSPDKYVDLSYLKEAQKELGWR